MKCLPECGFQQMPNSIPGLVRHMQECDLDGPLRNVESPVVVWRDGEFCVVASAKKKETTFNVGFERIVHEIEMPILDIDLVDGFNTAEVVAVIEEVAAQEEPVEE